MAGACRTKGPRVLGVFVNQLKRLADVPIRNCTEPPTFAGTKGFDPAAQHFDKQHLGHSREHSELAGTLERCLSYPASSVTAVGESHFRR